MLECFSPGKKMSSIRPWTCPSAELTETSHCQHSFAQNVGISIPSSPWFSHNEKIDTTFTFLFVYFLNIVKRTLPVKLDCCPRCDTMGKWFSCNCPLEHMVPCSYKNKSKNSLSLHLQFGRIWYKAFLLNIWPSV